jgi:hypothetical protein
MPTLGTRARASRTGSRSTGRTPRSTWDTQLGALHGGGEFALAASLGDSLAEDESCHGASALRPA